MQKFLSAVRIGLAAVTLVLAPAEALAAMPSRPDAQDSMSALRIRIGGVRIGRRRRR